MNKNKVYNLQVLKRLLLMFILLATCSACTNTKQDTGVDIKKIYDQSGNLKKEFHFITGTQQYVLREYSSNGMLYREVPFDFGEKNGLEKYYGDTFHAETNYKDGIEEGLTTYHDKDGDRTEINYTNGKKEGTMKKYDSSNQLTSEINYKNDQLNGIAKKYYDDGKLLSEINYKNGQPNGISRFYYNGILRIESNNLNGQLEGISKTYWGPNLLRYVDVYNHDHLVSRKAYDEEGKFKFEQNY